MTFLAYLGRISYSIYLFHMPVNALTAIALQALGSPIDGWLIFSLSLLSTIGVSALSFKYIEMPFIRMGKSLQSYYLWRIASRSAR